MLFWLTLAVAFDEPPVADVATVAFSADGARVAVETRWVEEGPGFPNAKIELRDTANNAVLGQWSERLVEHAAHAGFEGASAGARAKAADALGREAVDLSRAATAIPCADGVCARDGGGGCVRARDALRYTITSTPSGAKSEQCYGRGVAHLLTLSVNGRTWVAEDVPADGCPANWTVEAAYVHGERAVLLLGYDVPGHEGRARRTAAMAGSMR